MTANQIDNAPAMETKRIPTMFGMCAVRCPIEVHVRDDKPVWLQGNASDPGMGTGLCPKGAAGIALSDRSGSFIDLTKSFLKSLGSSNYFDHDCSCGGNAHNASHDLFGVGRMGLNVPI